MDHNHYLTKTTGGFLICSICCMVFYETVEGIKQADHLPHNLISNDYQLIGNNYTSTASMVSGTITFTKLPYQF